MWLVLTETELLQPGAYPGDDGSPEITERYNFYAHGKRFLVCSLVTGTRTGAPRQLETA